MGYSVGRYYDPQTGQFLTVDPLIDVTGTPYAYVSDNPVNVTDPTGLAALWGDAAYAACAPSTWQFGTNAPPVRTLLSGGGPGAIEDLRGPEPGSQRSIEIARGAVQDAIERLKNLASGGNRGIYGVPGGYKELFDEAGELLGSQYHLRFKIEPQTTVGGPAYVYTLDDGTTITIRPTSKSGTPALEITNRTSPDPQLRNGYKFHFT